MGTASDFDPRNSTLRIELSGSMGVGKSMIANVIRKALRDAGAASVEFTVPDPATHELPTEYNLPEQMAPTPLSAGWLGMSNVPNRKIEISEKIEKIDFTTFESKININGEDKVAKGALISYEQVVQLIKADDTTKDYSMVYSKGDSEKPSGILITGQSVKLRPGMIFTFVHTGNA